MEKDGVVVARDLEGVDPSELLRRAQAAFEQGKEMDARTLALEAAKGIASMEAEKASRRLRELQIDWQNAVQTSEDAESLLAKARDDFKTTELALKQSQASAAETTATFEERNAINLEVKRELEEVEKRLGEVQDRHRELLARLEETLPAMEAAQREQRKALAEMERAALAYRDLSRRAEEAEDAASRARERRAIVDRELKELRKQVEGRNRPTTG